MIIYLKEFKSDEKLLKIEPVLINNKQKAIGFCYTDELKSSPEIIVDYKELKKALEVIINSEIFKGID